MDPPYNIEKAKAEGNQFSEKEDVKASKFIYRDKFSRNGWLNMMNERLKMAHTLLKDDGVIFVSIDDKEQAYLKVLMDEIFKEENFVANLVCQKKNSGSGDDSKHLKVLTEYILLYTKNIDKLVINTIKKDIDTNAYKFEDEHADTRGKYLIKQLDVASLSWSEKLDYEFEYEGKIYYPGGSKEKWLIRQNGKHAKKDWQWRWSKDKLIDGIKNGYIVFKNNKIYSKQYQFVDNSGNLIERQDKFNNLIIDSNKHGTQGTAVLKSVFDGFKIFDHPKPTNLLKHIINMHPNKNARVLDLFAGSGTTAHAVLELNKEDGGNRSFTIVTNDENGIGTNICYERVYRINKGIGTNGQKFDWARKNEPFKDNLNVFKVKYFDTSITSKQNDLIKETFRAQLKDFNITKVNEENIDDRNILVSLTALKPIKNKE
ncbi:site-specific DNA-methyltransferase [Ureaplasma diversum]|uniref:site-specific DNA-methyltransferase n=1 Tax=Ureaplasma diversum TaxID=42094 RepID=UPI001FCF8B53|nr:site-specific DNA-methyltransferase [Ureaplasma diversum]